MKTQLTDYAGFYEDVLGELRWSNKGEAKTNCPFHEERNPSFSINRDTGMYICFVCGEKGNAYTFAKSKGLNPLTQPFSQTHYVKPSVLKSKPKTWRHQQEYVYEDLNGKPYRLVGIDGAGDQKKVCQYHMGSDGKWYAGGPKIILPSRVKEVLEAIQMGKPVVFV